MTRQRGIKVLSIVALLIAVVGLTVAFAAMSRTLTINGTATMDTAKWDILFEDLQVSNPVGAARLVKAPTIQKEGTHLGDFEVILTKPGDAVEFTFNVKNDGDIDAKYTDFLVIGNAAGEETKTSYFDSSKMQQLLESIYIEADWDGDGKTTWEETQKCMEQGLGIGIIGFPMSQRNKVLKPGESDSITIKVYFSNGATELPKGDIKINANIELLFEQA